MNATPQQALAAYEKALASYDWEQIAPLIHPDACFLFSTGSHHGKEAIGVAMRRVFSLISDERYRISALHWGHIGADIACASYRFDWQGVIDGELASGAGRGSCTLLRDEVHGWRLLSEHLGPLPE